MGSCAYYNRLLLGNGKLVAAYRSQLRSLNSAFVPVHQPLDTDELKRLQEVLDASPRILTLTGAGISTESGIPDYRSEGVGLYARSKSRPVQYQDFIKSAHVRQRYWARNFVGWERFFSFVPNEAHISFAQWEKEDRIERLVTQNVDRLHHKAGSERVTELHGTAFEVICLSCSHLLPRSDFQNTLKEYNPGISIIATEQRPDGDVELHQEIIERFRVPACPKCQSGVLKPDIVFFGDNVPRSRVDEVFSALYHSDLLFIVGSSLSVFSGYRFALKAAELNIPIAILNIGPTRADHLAKIKISARIGEVLPLLRV